MTIERIFPTTDPHNERESLNEWLDFHRATLLWKCEGLSDEQLQELEVDLEAESSRIMAPGDVAKAIRWVHDHAAEHGGNPQAIYVMGHSAGAHLVALVASAFILWFFGRFDTVQMEMAIAQTVVLSLPATLGASAGRLLLQS